ncbi:alpha/beta hydrolase domain-containing protein [Pseudarthrobacter sp. YAF2]|uniref:alpha/beta hydrolase domain-containing protein n=1 Tax=Pseudarthrobacter sp. YAF2 TaxID=3233078 RepID=UPI003F9DF690
MIYELSGATESPSHLPQQISENVAVIKDSGYDIREFTITEMGRQFAENNGAMPHPVLATSYFTNHVITVVPLRPERFSGYVHLELLNPSGGVESSMFWPDAAGYVLRRADAYVGLTCKSVIVEALKRSAPDRNARLSVEYDGLLWDAIAAVARALRAPAGGGLLPGLKGAERIVANGSSQSGSFLRSYLSGHRALSRGETRALYGSLQVYRERVERRMAELVERRWYLPEHTPAALNLALGGVRF